MPSNLIALATHNGALKAERASRADGRSEASTLWPYLTLFVPSISMTEFSCAEIPFNLPHVISLLHQAVLVFPVPDGFQKVSSPFESNSSCSAFRHVL